MKPLNHILIKCTGGYKLHKSQGKINHQIYTDDIKLFDSNKKIMGAQIEAVRIHSQDIGID